MHFSTITATAAAAAFTYLPLVSAAPVAEPQSTLPLCDPSNLIVNGDFEVANLANWTLANGPSGMYEFAVQPYSQAPSQHYFSGVYIPSEYYPQQQWYTLTQTFTNNLPATVSGLLFAGLGQWGHSETWQYFQGSEAEVTVFIDGTQLRSYQMQLFANQYGASAGMGAFTFLPKTIQPGTHTFVIKVEYESAIGDTEVVLDHVSLTVAKQSGCRTS